MRALKRTSIIAAILLTLTTVTSGFAGAAASSTATSESAAKPAAWQWEYVGYYDTENDCNYAGAVRVANGQAAAYECNYDLAPAPWHEWGLWLGFNNG